MAFEQPLICWDLETERFAPGYMAPKPVCLTWAHDQDFLTFGPGVGSRLHTDEYSFGICATSEIWNAAQHVLQKVSCGHHIVYDLGCLVAHYADLVVPVLQALKENRIIDTMILERLAEIYKGDGRGPLGLSFIGQKYGLPALAGKSEDEEVDSIQCSYGPLLGAPIEAYTKEQIQYATLDAIHDLRLFRRQEIKWLQPQKVFWNDLAELNRRAFWLHMAHCRGLRTDPYSIEELFEVTSAEIKEFQSEFVKLGFLRQDRDGTCHKNTEIVKQWVAYAYDNKPPMTKESGDRKKKQREKAKQGKPTKDFEPSISIARATLEESGNPILEDFARYGETAAVLNKDLPMLLKGTEHPIHTHWGIASTCRTTSSGPNIQNPRRGSPKKCRQCGAVYHSIKKSCPKCKSPEARTLMGIRECFIPRPGYAFVAIDHSGIELCTLAQQIVKALGLRRMADRINSGADLHSDVGCLIANLPYEEFRRLYKAGDETISLQRNCGKVYQFGRHGGMGAKTLRYYAKQGYHLDLSLEFCEQLIQIGKIANPDGAEWLRSIDRMFPQDREGRFTVKCWGSNVTRGGCTYSAAANHPFQHLATMIESKVGFEMIYEQLTGFTSEGVRSPLGECFMCNFVHDEFIFEAPIHLVHEVDQRLQYLMTTVPRVLLPDVQVKAESVAMDRWSKKARRIEENGILKVWHYERAA